MPLVFVHGVNVRWPGGKDPRGPARDAMFRALALEGWVSDPASSLILTPYWGDRGARFIHDHGGLPEGDYEEFGPEGEATDVWFALDLSGLDAADPEQPLLSMARHSFEAAVDLLWEVGATQLLPEMPFANDFGSLSALVGRYVDEHPRPDWLAHMRDDEDFVSHLFRQAAGDSALAPVEAFGISEVKDMLRRAAKSLRARWMAAVREARGLGERADAEARKHVDQGLLRLRAPVHRTVATFLGDAFVYFRQREGGERAIAQAVESALVEAHAQRQGEPLIVVAHSMGGNIAYDLLTTTLRDLHVDVLATVGSQVAVMQELGMFSFAPVAPEAQPRRPDNVDRWLNVFDARDVLGFAAARVFNGVEDYHFATGRLWAHGGYFLEPAFHKRLGQRLRGEA